jgi:hypothetical protein
MELLVSLEELSPAQREFASCERASPGMRGTTGVFLYREELRATYRWLVSKEGYVLDAARFARAASEASAADPSLRQIAV